MDVIEGRGPCPLFVYSLVLGLPDTSMTAALMAGGMEFYGWGQDRALSASLHDLLGVNVRASGNWKNKPPDIPQWPRPKKRVEDMTPEEQLDALFNSFGVVNMNARSKVGGSEAYVKPT